MIVSPVVPPKVKVPLLTLRLICSTFPPLSASLTLMALPWPLEKTSGVASGDVCAAGTVLTGASLTWLTVMLTVLVVGFRAARTRVAQVVAHQCEGIGTV